MKYAVISQTICKGRSKRISSFFFWAKNARSGNASVSAQLSLAPTCERLPALAYPSATACLLDQQCYLEHMMNHHVILWSWCLLFAVVVTVEAVVCWCCWYLLLLLGNIRRQHYSDRAVPLVRTWENMGKSWNMHRLSLVQRLDIVWYSMI